VSAEGGVPLASARQLCAAVVNARYAAGVIQKARTERTEFPEDLLNFEVTAKDAVRLAEARLADAELMLRERTPGARTCGDARVRERLESGVKERTAALRAVGTKLPSLAPLLLEVAKERDPSPEVRAAAAASLEASAKVH